MVIFFLHPPGGSGGRGDDDASNGPRAPTGTPPDASTFALKLFLASLAMFFFASMIGYVWIRLTNESWDGYKHDGGTFGLVLSTILLIGCSVAHHLALVGIKRGDRRALSRWLSVTYVLALAFLVNQAWNWKSLVEAKGWLASGTLQSDPNALSMFLFYVLTALHALHVVGGFVPLTIVGVRTSRGRYDASHWKGVHESALYWHFLDAVWILIATALLIG